jgi:hypothetical protein
MLYIYIPTMNHTVIEPAMCLIESIITVGGTILMGFFMGFAVVGLFIYTPPVNDEEDEVIYDAEAEYINKYFDELDEMEDADLDKDTLIELRNLFLCETTPRGDIVMTYNSDTQSFWYWSDNKNITYSMLDAAARKFAIDYNCKAVCVNYKSEFNNSYDAIVSRKEDKAVEDKAVEDKAVEDKSVEDKAVEDKAVVDKAVVSNSVFAKFKSYNTARTETTSNTKQHLLTEKANRFSHKGTLEDYEKSKEKTKTNSSEENEEVKSIDFATFKKMMLSESVGNTKIKTS